MNSTPDHCGCTLKIIPCFDRKEIRELGMTLVINARKKSPPLHLYKALLMAQVRPTHLQQQQIEISARPS